MDAAVPREPSIEDRGSYIEVSMGGDEFGQLGFIDVLVACCRRFGTKPILMLCNDSMHAVTMTQAYEAGVELAARLPLRKIAIALLHRTSSSADRFTELVAQNRGTEVRYFESVQLAKAWLGVS